MCPYLGSTRSLVGGRRDPTARERERGKGNSNNPSTVAPSGRTCKGCRQSRARGGPATDARGAFGPWPSVEPQKSALPRCCEVASCGPCMRLIPYHPVGEAAQLGKAAAGVDVAGLEARDGLKGDAARARVQLAKRPPADVEPARWQQHLRLHRGIFVEQAQWPSHPQPGRRCARTQACGRR